jgi:hypothetical protein
MQKLMSLPSFTSSPLLSLWAKNDDSLFHQKLGPCKIGDTHLLLQGSGSILEL